MFNSSLPSTDELPSSRQLLRSTLIALMSAMVLLVGAVMPAEYGIDPTGIGRMLGLTQMGQTKMALARAAAADAGAPAATASIPAAVQQHAPASPVPTLPAAAPDLVVKQHTMSITLKPNERAEVKLEMKVGAKVSYHWTANGGRLNYDTHGEPYNAPRNFYHGYGKGVQVPEDKGVLVAAFDGKHGWFWRNRTDKTVTVTLRVDGNFIKVERVL